MAAQVALRRQQEAQLKRHLAQELMRGAASPKAHSHGRKAASRPGLPRECLWPKMAPGLGWRKHEEGKESQASTELLCDLGQGVSILWASASPPLRCGHVLGGCVEICGRKEENSVFLSFQLAWDGVRRKDSPELSLVPHSRKGEHRAPASGPPRASSPGTDRPWEGKKSRALSKSLPP